VPGDGQADFVLRFHLHPNVQAELAPGSQGLRLILADGQEWLFRASGLAVTIEESIFLGGREGPRNTSQIVIPARVRDNPSIVWTMERLG
jgi:uncharacterized heparinase superfamily protein